MKTNSYLLLLLLPLVGVGTGARAAESRSLAGDWKFRRDDQKVGEQAAWFASSLDSGQTIKLPGTMDEARLGIANPDPPSLAGLYNL